jgi:hypothetical protein
MAADPVSRLGQLQMRDIAFAAQIPHLEELKQNDTSFNRTAVVPEHKFPLTSVWFCGLVCDDERRTLSLRNDKVPVLGAPG